MKIVSVAEMQQIERQADAQGLHYAQMMENAGRNLAEAVIRLGLPPDNLTVLALVGSGNNGGDALVALAYLASSGWKATAYLTRPRPGDPLVERLLLAGGTILESSSDPQFRQLQDLVKHAAVLLDGILGTGAKPPLRSDLAELLASVQGCLKSHQPAPVVVAVDCPSGLDCDTGTIALEALKADVTVTMAAAKKGLFLFPGAEKVGRLELVGIGALDGIPSWDAVKRFVVDLSWVREKLPARPFNAHKGTFGTALVCAGSLAYTGAAWLAGQAAYRSGVGLVTLAAPAPLHAALAGHIPEATWLLLPHMDGWIAPEAAAVVVKNMHKATAVLVGPGWGQEAGTAEFLAGLLRATETDHNPPPFVVDADGLKLLTKIPDWPSHLPAGSILTPHPGEMGVLTGLSTAEINRRRIDLAEEYAAQWGQVVVLKGAFTVIASPDGSTAVIPVANPALAKAGTGDVLAGITVGLRAQGMPAFEAAAAAAFLHASAGLLAAEKLGTVSVMAGDVLRTLPDVLGKTLQNEL